MNRGRLILSFLVALFMQPHSLPAQTCTPVAILSYTNSEGEVTEETFAFGDEGNEAALKAYSAPVKALFTANPSDYEGFEPRYEWRIYASNDTGNTLVFRSEESMDYTFSQHGEFIVELKVSFLAGEDVILYPEEGNAPARFTVKIAESKLEMPNAFSPNGDGQNDVYRAKPTHQSIVEFKASIFNRWGQRLYSWDNVNGFWDGKVNGRIVEDGVYFVNVVAKGADGVEYKIRKDVNVLTRHKEDNEK